MMIVGVAYHVIPRFTGHAPHSRRLAGVQWWLANGGLLNIWRTIDGASPRGRAAATQQGPPTVTVLHLASSR
jgi:hypothetical protein